jgi:hypothetical protein
VLELFLVGKAMMPKELVKMAQNHKPLFTKG